MSRDRREKELERRGSQLEHKDHEPDYAAIGRRIRAARKALGITQDRLSELAGLSPAHMSHIENGTTKVSLPSLLAIANALHVTPNDLLYDNVAVLQGAYDKEFRDLTEDLTTRERGIIYSCAREIRRVLKD